MNERKANLWLSATALALAAGGTAASLCQVGGGGSWVARCGWFAATLALSAGSIWLFWKREARLQKEARQYLELACRQDEPDPSTHQPGGSLPALDATSGWQATVKLVRETLSQKSVQLAQVEQSRSALEIRCRRHAAELDRATKILGGLPEPVIVVDRYDELLLANASAQRLFGLDAEQAQQGALSRLIECEKLVALLSDVRRRKVATSRTDEVQLAGPGGAERWYGVTATSIPAGPEPQAGAEGGQGVVAVLRDISAQKLIQRQNAEFVSAASHEMKTPLAGIKAYVELLVDGDAEDEATREQFLGVINSQADRLQRLIDNLLNLARIEAGVVKVSKQSQSLNEILAEAARVVQLSAEAKQIQLVEELSPLYLGVLADRDMMLQAAINLLSNAVKYTRAGGKVTLRSRLADREVQFEVEDTGVGLGEEDCRRVFEKFYRVEKDKQMASGTGLGLPLAKYIAEDVHGGRLSVTSTLGMGSTFRITLPSAGQMS